MITSLLTAAATAAVLSGDAVNQALDALELHYINEEIYSPVVCKSAEGNTRFWLRCTGAQADAPIGGLFFVLPDKDGNPMIWTGNGRAKQHLGSLTELPDMYGEPVKAGKWTGDPVDLSEGFEAFGVAQ